MQYCIAVKLHIPASGRASVKFSHLQVAALWEAGSGAVFAWARQWWLLPSLKSAGDASSEVRWADSFRAVSKRILRRRGCGGDRGVGSLRRRPFTRIWGRCRPYGFAALVPRPLSEFSPVLMEGGSRGVLSKRNHIQLECCIITLPFNLLYHGSLWTVWYARMLFIIKCQYCIVGIFCGWKLSRISQFWDSLRKFYWKNSHRVLRRVTLNGHVTTNGRWQGSICPTRAFQPVP